MCFEGVMQEETDCGEWKGQDVREPYMAAPLPKHERSRAEGE